MTGWLTDDALTNPVDLAAQQKKSENNKRLSLNDFISRFNSMASNLGSGHKILKKNMVFSSGPVNDSYQIKYAGCLIFSLFVAHGTDDFVQSFIIYGGDKNGDYSTHLIYLITELFYATGVIGGSSETGAILNRLKFSNMYDGAFNSIIVNGWRAYISLSSVTGFMCGVEEP